MNYLKIVVWMLLWIMGIVTLHFMVKDDVIKMNLFGMIVTFACAVDDRLGSLK